MIEKISSEEVDFLDCFYNPISLTECLFSDLDNLTFLEEDIFSEIRLAQFPMLSYEYLLDYDTNLSKKQNFKLKEGAGTVYCLGGRRFGKTLIVEIIDLLIAMIHNNGEECGFSSYDFTHIRGILEKIIQVLENHPFFSMFNAKINRSPTYRIFLKNGFTLDSVNMNLASTNPGASFFQKHFTRLYIEECSFETEEVYKKRIDAVSELGCVFRLAGMTNFTKYSPIGKIFYELEKYPWIVNLPQYCNPRWDEKEKENAIKEHGGEESISFRLFVKGEVVEDAVSVMDMERIKKNYNRNKTIKHFEITKDNFIYFESVLVVERPNGVDNIFISADIGESAPTEIIVLSEVERKYKYLYNITVYNLTDKEQFKIFKYLSEKLKANIVSLDTTDGTGRAIFHSLEEVFPKENLQHCSFNEKIKVDIEKDENTGKEIFKDGKPVWREEYVEVWSIKRLKDLLYEEGKVEIPLDFKLDTQLNSIISTQSGNRTLFKCISEEDHLLAAWKVFAIAEWLNYLNIVKSIQKKTFCKTI